MELVQNKPEYWEFIRNLRNHPDVKGGLFSKKILKKSLMSSICSGMDCFLCLFRKQPAGYVGVIDRDIRVATHPDFQGKGVGKYMIN